MLERGIEQWPSPFPRELIESSVRDGQTYLATDAGTLVGSIALLNDDESRWGVQAADAQNRSRPGHARYGLG